MSYYVWLGHMILSKNQARVLPMHEPAQHAE